MTKHRHGFSIVELLIIIAVVAILGVLGKLAYDKFLRTDLREDKQVSVEKKSFDKTPIKSLGFNLDYYDPATNKAGDFQFTKEPIYDGYLFGNYGKAAANPGPNGEKDMSPQSSFLLPLGTKVHSIVDGVVYDVKQLYSGDYSIQVDVGNDAIYYEMEHVMNPLVKKGDRVTAGQIVAEVSTHNSKNNAGLGMFEVGVLQHGNPPYHLCFFDHLDESVKADLDKKILAFYKSWEEYVSDDSIYDEAAMPTPGCDSREPISDTNDYRKES
ncbi:MAG: peptidoglycan DD-metalloendopeptidase family protein [Candidatus Saccharimonas sp.]